MCLKLRIAKKNYAFYLILSLTTQYSYDVSEWVLADFVQKYTFTIVL